MSGSHSGLVSHHVLTDEGEELPLLAGRAARKSSRRWSFAADRLEAADRFGYPFGSDLDGRLDFHRRFRSHEFVLHGGT